MEISNVWLTLLQLYKQIEVGPSSSQVAGGNVSVIERIEEELQKDPPDWKAVILGLDQLESICNGMLKIAEENHLKPVSDPHFIQLLQETSQTIADLKNEVGKPGFSLNSLMGELIRIKQDILQG